LTSAAFSPELFSSPRGVTRLFLQNFRNYSYQDFGINSSVIILHGENGAGKTNVLESLSFFSPGRGLRNSKLSQVTNLKSLDLSGTLPSWAVSIDLETDHGSMTLGTGIDLTSSGSEKRIVKVNVTVVKSQAELTEWLGVIWITPHHDRLFLEASSVRRKFIDRLIYAIDPTHAERVHRYEHYLKERSLLLREGRWDPAWLSVLEGKMAEVGVAICVSRQQLLQKIQLCQNLDRDYPFPRLFCSMVGELEKWLEDHSALTVEDLFKERLAQSRSQDAESGGASTGAHRSDMVVKHVTKNMPADLCSTGEQKMLLLGFILAFIRVRYHYQSTCCLLLFDDIVAHLDDYHRTVLFQEITASGISNHTLQTWMTGTDIMAFTELQRQAQFVTVSHSTLMNSL
jgi:DNA replication and repair protein RecF